jgi:hypothetical protein
MLYNQLNSLIKAVKDEKLSKMMKRTADVKVTFISAVQKISGEIGNIAYIKKVLAKSKPNFKAK